MTWGDNFPGSSLDNEKWDDNAIGGTIYTVGSNKLSITDCNNYSWFTVVTEHDNQIQSIMELPSEFEISCRVRCIDNAYDSLGQFGVALVRDNGDIVAFIGYMDYEAGVNTLRRYCIAENDFDYKNSEWNQSTSDDQIIQPLAVTDDYMDITFEKQGSVITISTDAQEEIGHFTCSNSPVHFAIITGRYNNYAFMGTGEISSVTSDIGFTADLKSLIDVNPVWYNDLKATITAQTPRKELEALIDVYYPINWYNQDWIERAEVDIPGSIDGELYNHPVMVEVPYIEGSMREDRGDIRFTDVDGVTLLDYELLDVSPEYPDYIATFMVLVPYIPPSPQQKSIFCYINNPSATTSSSPEDVYPFYDAFPGSSLDSGNWPSSNGVEVYGDNLVLDYHSNYESGGEDYVLSDFTVTEGSRTIFNLRPETLEGPLRFGLTSGRTTFQSDIGMYLGFVLRNEYIYTNYGFDQDDPEIDYQHHTIQQYDLNQHTFMIDWLESGINFYYNGELIKSYTSPGEYGEPLKILVRDRGFVDYVKTYPLTEHEPVTTLGGFERPSEYLRAKINIPYKNDVKSLIDIYPVHDSIPSIILARVERPSDLKSLIRAYPLHGDLKTILEVAGLFEEDLKALIEVAGGYTTLNQDDLYAQITVNNGGIYYNNYDLDARILVGRVFRKEFDLKWNVIMGDITTEGSDTPKLVMQIEGGSTYG